jgi:transposase InsO family protein
MSLDNRNIDEFYEAVKRFIKEYNEKWLFEKLGYQSPLEARKAWRQSKEKRAA